MTFLRRFAFFAGLCFAPLILNAAYEPEVAPSTSPIGSSFYRHLAFDNNLDLKELVKFEKRGFGRTEIVTLVLISKSTGKPLKEYGKRRLNDKVPLRTFAQEANLDYPTLHSSAQSIKEGIENKGDSNLPPPVFEDPKPDPAEEAKKEKEKRIKEKADRKAAKEKEKQEKAAEKSVPSEPIPESAPTP